MLKIMSKVQNSFEFVVFGLIFIRVSDKRSNWDNFLSLLKQTKVNQFMKFELFWITFSYI